MINTIQAGVAVGVLAQQVPMSFAGTDGSQHQVVVPAGTACKKIEGKWVVSDLSFFDRKSMAYCWAAVLGLWVTSDLVSQVL